MPPLHMEVETCQQNSQKIQQAHDEIERQVQAMSTMVLQMVGNTWNAPAANEFGNDYMNWEQQEKNSLQVLAELKQRLDQEIAQWIETGSKMG